MSLRTYLIGLAVSSALCWFALVFTLVNANPSQGRPAFLSLYISLFVALLGTLTLAGYLARRYLRHNQLRYALIRVAFRQGFLLSGAIIVCLLLQSIRLVSWWDVALLATIFMLFELYLRSHDYAAAELR